MKKPTMTGQQRLEMQQKIDKGILLAQQRLVQRAQREKIELVMFRDGKIVEMIPEAEASQEALYKGNPLYRRCNK